MINSYKYTYNILYYIINILGITRIVFVATYGDTNTANIQ